MTDREMTSLYNRVLKLAYRDTLDSVLPFLRMPIFPRVESYCARNPLAKEVFRAIFKHIKHVSSKSYFASLPDVTLTFTPDEKFEKQTDYTRQMRKWQAGMFTARHKTFKGLYSGEPAYKSVMRKSRLEEGAVWRYLKGKRLDLYYLRYLTVHDIQSPNLPEAVMLPSYREWISLPIFLREAYVEA